MMIQMPDSPTLATNALKMALGTGFLARNLNNHPMPAHSPTILAIKFHVFFLHQDGCLFLDIRPGSVVIFFSSLG
jgi:hypothetical protein